MKYSHFCWLKIGTVLCHFNNMSVFASNSSVTNGLIFCIDTKNVKSYRGIPLTNKLTGITSWNGTVNTTNYKISDKLEDMYIPGLDKTVTARSVSIYNNDPANNCCPSLLQYGYPAATNFIGNTVYTYAILYRVISGYTTANYMYHYEYNGGSFLTEYGVHDDSKRIALGDNWYYAWNNLTTQPTANTINFGSWYYQYNVYDKFSVAAVNFFQGNYVPPVEQMLAINESRTVTNGLIDLTYNSTLDLTNAAYDANGNITFNGGNYIVAPENAVFNTQTPTVEVWIKTNSTTQNGFFFEKGTVNSQYSLFQEGTNIVWRQRLSIGLTSMYATTATYISTSKWAHIVGTFTSGDRRLYINGALVASDTESGTIDTNPNGISIGAYGGYNGGRGFYYSGQIGMVKVYNRALSGTEVLQNYDATKSRFNL